MPQHLQVAMPCMINFTKVEPSKGYFFVNMTHHAASEEECGPRPWLFPENLNLDFGRVSRSIPHPHSQKA